MPIISPTLSRRAVLAVPAAFARKAALQSRRELFLPSPARGTAVMAYAFYTQPHGGEMISIEERWSRSDTVDFAFIRRSHDYGRTWTAPVARATGERRSDGMLRRQPRCGFVDHNGRYLEFWCEGVLPSDDPLEGLRQWNIYFHVSQDGGRTFDAPTQVIHAGAEFNSGHPLPGVWTGKNCVMIGEITCVPINAPDGGILLPVEMTPLAPNGQLYNPAGTRSYTEALMLRGEWQGSRLDWTASEPIRAGTGQSTRGMDEPTIEYLDGDRLLMVLRGSNDRRPDLPGYRWFSVSHDGGKHWTPAKPWTYDDGREFFSPSACSQLLRHPSGRLFWLGNITAENPRGNRPRYPFVVGEVDRVTGLLRRTSIRTIDTLKSGEDSILSLSNFYARVDRRTHEIAIHMTRLFARSEEWAGDAYVYRIAV
jgi:hypothetical protein